MIALLWGCTNSRTTGSGATPDCASNDQSCGRTTADTGCPSGWHCSGPSSNVCIRGNCGYRYSDCLPPAAAIGTPDGERPVRSLRPGDLVWTLDTAGARVAAPLVRLRTKQAPPGHLVVRADLADGRSVRASPDHPTTDGRTLGDLAPGDRLDGADVVAVQREPYPFARTWDVLPAGPTGAYLADGVWLGSTLTGLAEPVGAPSTDGPRPGW